MKNNVKNMKIIEVILVEDDKFICAEVEKAIAVTADIKLVKVTDNAILAVEFIRQYSPDIVILDLMLAEGGHGDHVLKDIRNLGSAIHQPGIAVLTDNGNKNLYKYYTGYKGVDTYSIKNVTFSGDEVVNIIRRTHEIVKRIGVNMPEGEASVTYVRPDSHAEKVKRLEVAVSARLERDGMITGRGTGKVYLIDLIVLAVQKGGMLGFKLKEHEVIVAKKNNTTPTKVSRNVATAIERAYNYVIGGSCDFDNTPFLRDERYITPYAMVSYYAEIFLHSLD